MKSGVILCLVTAAMGCQVPAMPAPEGAPPHRVVGEELAPRRVVDWRLVERTYAEADPAKGVAGDGLIPGPSRLLIYEPIFEQLRTMEYGSLQVRTGCEHGIRLRIVGGLSRSVGERVTVECRIDCPAAMYHELSIAPASGGIAILEVRGVARAMGKPGRYLVPGDRVFEIVFTSTVVGRGMVGITLVREVGQDSADRSGTERALVAEER